MHGRQCNLACVRERARHKYNQNYAIVMVRLIRKHLLGSDVQIELNLNLNLLQSYNIHVYIMIKK